MNAPPGRIDLAALEAGAEVMGTGIVSVALSLAGAETLSRILLVIAAVTWGALVLSVAARARGVQLRGRRGGGGQGDL